ncbi:MAG TPA: methyltransferase domain-containing protein [Actinomycetota bacterium]|jgi:SAM-dependent methyltransferase|nr:methyltransferase domain-containing protein [Actinomycetota bacterium]
MSTEDLLFQDEIKNVVRSVYQEIPTGGGEDVATKLYAAEELDEVPAGAVTWALGVGNPVRHAGLTSGETVVDLGSGGGIDSILAARRVGPTGRVIGVDLLDEMVERASDNARSAGVADWTEFVRGEMEDLPLPDTSVDVVISNGVINLSPRKSRVFAEIFRVLRPGGRMCVSDLTVEDDLPPEIMTSDAAWAG